MQKLLIVLVLWVSSVSFADPLFNLVTVSDGLEYDNVENISDDYIRLALLVPSYRSATNIQQAIESWLGPGMAIIDSKASVKVQAPRDSSKRVTFISALLALEINN